MNLLFYRSYVFFARTGGNPYDRMDERTSPKKFATYLKTKVSSLKKLVVRSVDPVDAGLTVFAQGSAGAIRPAYSSGLRVTGEQIHNVPENKSLMGKLIGQFYKKSRYEISKTVRHGLYGRGTIAKSRGTITTECDRLDKFRPQFCWAKIGQKTPFSARKKIRFRKRIIC